MRICIVVNLFPDYNETFIFNKIVSLIHQGNTVRVVCFQREKQLRDAFEKFSIDDKQLNIRQIPNLHHLSNYIISVFKFPFYFLSSLHFHPKKMKKKFQQKIQTRFLNKLKCKIIYFDTLKMGIYFLTEMDKLKSFKVVGCKHLKELHELTDEKEDKRILQQLFKKVDLVHCLSKEIEQKLLTFSNQPYKVFINAPAVDANFFMPKATRNTKEKFQIYSIGRLSFDKGYLTGISAIQRLVQQQIPVHWTIVGEGSYYKELKFHIENAGLIDHVALLGARSNGDINNILDKADCLLNTSYTKCFSNYILEAMSKEIPVIVTESNTAKELINDGEEGFIVPAYDVESIVDRIKLLYENEDLKYRISVGGRKKVLQQFTLKHQGDIFQKHYRKLT